MSIKIDINIKEFKKKQVKKIRDCIDAVSSRKELKSYPKNKF